MWESALPEAPLPPEKQEALFQDIIRKMSSAKEPAKLEELALLALSLMLRWADDPKGTRDKFTGQIKAITAAVKSSHQADATRKAMVVAAKGCIQVLKAAKEERPPRPPEPPPQPKPVPQAEPEPDLAESKPSDEDGDNTAKVVLAAVAAIALVTVGAGYFLWRYAPVPVPAATVAEQPSSEASPPAISAEAPEASKFADLMFRAAREPNPPVSHMFGGAVEVRSILGGHHIVTARDVPAQICADAGMVLADKGLLSINGQALAVATPDGLGDLCRRNGESATVTWSPRQ